MVFQIYTIDCDSMREGLCSTCKTEINESMKVCPNCGTPILWDPQAQGYPPQGYPPVQGPPVAGYPTTTVDIQKKKSRHHAAAFLCLCIAFFMIIMTTVPWIVFEIDAIGWGDEATLQDFDEEYGTGHNGTLLTLSLFLMILSCIALIHYHIVLKSSMLLLGFAALVACIHAITNIANKLDDKPVFKYFWGWTPAPFFYLLGCFFFMIFAAAMRGPKEVQTMMLPQQPYGVPPRVQ